MEVVSLLTLLFYAILLIVYTGIITFAGILIVLVSENIFARIAFAIGTIIFDVITIFLIICAMNGIYF